MYIPTYIDIPQHDQSESLSSQRVQETISRTTRCDPYSIIHASSSTRIIVARDMAHMNSPDDESAANSGNDVSEKLGMTIVARRVASFGGVRYTD